jgi:hypothetical protein
MLFAGVQTQMFHVKHLHRDEQKAKRPRHDKEMRWFAGGGNS